MAKIDMSEVKQLKKDLAKKADKAVSSIAETKSGLGKIKDMESFKGSGANATKNYISSAHNNLIEVYDNIIEDLKSNFTYSMEQFSSSVDDDGNCIIDSDYVTHLEADVTSATKSISSAIKSINKEITSISDITSASNVQTTEFKDDEKEFKKIITDMMEKFEAFISSSSNEVSQSKEFMGILTSMQGRVQKISNVSDGISTFKKSDIEKFKEWRKAAKNISKYGKKVAGTTHFAYHLSRGNIKITRAKNGKVRVRVMNPKALIGKVKWDGKSVKYVKRWKSGKPWKAITTFTDGKLTKTGKQHFKFWDLPKEITNVSKETTKQRLKGKVTGPFTGWKELTKTGKSLKALGIVGTTVEVGLNGYENYNDATKQGLTGSKRVVSTTVNTAIDSSVSIGGAAIGAKAGAIIGTSLGGPVGTVIGGVIGGIIGSGVAKEITKKTTDAIKSGVNRVVKDGIGKTWNNLGKWAFG